MARGLSEEVYYPHPCPLYYMITLVGLEKVGSSPHIPNFLFLLKVLERNQQIEVDIQSQVLKKLLAFRCSEY